MTGAHATLIDETGRVSGEVRCRSCGYDLQQLSAEGDCPECGVAIERSLRSDALRLADPDWLRRVGWGSRLMVIGLLLWVVLGLTFGIAVGVMSMAAAQTAYIGVIAVGTLVSILGLVRFTAPDPRGLVSVAADTVRKWTRGAGILGYAMPVAGSLIMIIPFNLSWGAVLVTSTAMTCVSHLALAVAAFAGMAYAATLASRIPEDKLVRQTRIVKWGLAAGFACLAVTTIVGNIVSYFWMQSMTTQALPQAAQSAPSGPGTTTVSVPAMQPTPVLDTLESVVQVAGVVVGLAMLVFTIWWIILMLRYRKRLNAAAEQAEQMHFSALTEPAP